MSWLTWVASILGMLSALGVTSRRMAVRYMSFWTGTLSSIALVYIYLQNPLLYPLLGMVAVYLIADVIGIWNNNPWKAYDEDL